MQGVERSGVVIDAQHDQAGQICPLASNLPVRTSRFRRPDLADGDSQFKYGALRLVVLHRNGQTKKARQMLNDRQAQTQAAVAARGAAVGLLEGLEHALLRGLVHADAGVA